jgi:hypothetical protein
MFATRASKVKFHNFHVGVFDLFLGDACDSPRSLRTLSMQFLSIINCQFFLINEPWGGLTDANPRHVYSRSLKNKSVC